MHNSTLAFIFDIKFEQVLLVHKLTPAWQNGKINGVGGKTEAGGTPLACIVRETHEETNLLIPPENWTPIGTMHGPDWQTDVFGTIYPGDQADARQGAHEAIAWFDLQKLPTTMIDNLTWLIPLTIDKLQSGQPEKITIHNL